MYPTYPHKPYLLPRFTTTTAINPLSEAALYYFVQAAVQQWTSTQIIFILF